MRTLIHSKYAQAHVEIIIAFVLFVGVILTFFLLIKPFSYTEEKPVENIQSAVLNSITEEVGILSVIIDSDNDCYSLDDVKDDYGENFVEIKNPVNQRKLTIYFHPMFSQKTISCESKPGRNYKLGVYTKENFIAEPKITTLKQNYETNYVLLKQQLGIRNDFSFGFRDFQGNIVDKLTPTNLKTSPTGVNVIAKEFPVQVIDKNAETNNYVFNLRVW